MLQADRPDDYVLATGTATTVGQWVEYCFSHVGLDWQDHVRFDEAYLRPTEVDALIGDASKARAALGWQARTMPEQLAKIMVDADLAEHSGARGRPQRPDAPRRTPPGRRAPAPDRRRGTDMSRPTALITGVTGQDGSYLAELLLVKGYEVHGLARRLSAGATTHVDHLLADPYEGRAGLVLHEGDLTDSSRLVSLLSTIA